jgi:hypothetical protein
LLVVRIDAWCLASDSATGVIPMAVRCMARPPSFVKTAQARRLGEDPMGGTPVRRVFAVGQPPRCKLSVSKYVVSHRFHAFQLRPDGSGWRMCLTGLIVV